MTPPRGARPSPPEPPQPTWRKPIGVLVLLLVLVLWMGAVTTLLSFFPPLPQPWAALAYLVGGFSWLWTFPMRRYLAWMETGVWTPKG